MDAPDDFHYEIPVKDAAGRDRTAVVTVSEESGVVVMVPPPGAAVIALEDVDRFVDAVRSAKSIAEHGRGRLA